MVFTKLPFLIISITLILIERTTCLADYGQDCKTNADCISNVCDLKNSRCTIFCQNHNMCPNKYCSTTQFMCIPAPYNYFCNQASDCLSKSCTSNSCDLSGIGLYCANDNECKSGHCTNNICVLGSFNHSCTSPAQCQSQICDPVKMVCSKRESAQISEFCSTSDECSSKYCFANICVRNSNGNPCQINNDCLSQNCTNSKCVGPSNFYFLCYGDNDCASGLRCIGFKCLKLCVYDSECPGGGGMSCSKYVWLDDTYKWMCNSYALGVAYECSFNEQCGSLRCVNGKCASSSFGGGCYENNDCNSKSCKWGACLKGNPGSDCISNDDCNSKNCNPVTLKCGLGSFFSPCQIGTDCISGYCLNGFCEKTRVGG